MSADNRDEDKQVFAGSSTEEEWEEVTDKAKDDAEEEEEEAEDGEPDEAEDGDGATTAAGLPEVSRKIRRRRRRTRPRSKTIAMKRLTREELRVGADVRVVDEEHAGGYARGGHALQSRAPAPRAERSRWAALARRAAPWYPSF
ncbi:MAG TPA: hypothetical protein PKU97_13565, partial [Kofleriaceae bacterium]|nr:hypothetical protein [Kofleriaceae bacterium]